MGAFNSVVVWQKVISIVKRKLSKQKRRFSNKLTAELVRELKLDLSGRSLIATKNGLYSLSSSKLEKLLNGEFYGITFYGDKVFVFEKFGKIGRILEFSNKLYNERISVLINNLSPGCHQIDVLGDSLMVTDTYNNRLLQFNLTGDLIDSFEPIGKLENGRKSKNYGHINSVYGNGENVYLLCHNESRKTGRKSEVLELSLKGVLLDRKQVKAESAHNCPLYKGKFLICDSLNNRVIHGEEEVFSCDLFTRGISIQGSRILIGGSEYASREQRSNARGTVYILNEDFKQQDTIEVPGMVQEIRAVDSLDLAMSPQVFL